MLCCEAMFQITVSSWMGYFSLWISAFAPVRLITTTQVHSTRHTFPQQYENLRSIIGLTFSHGPWSHFFHSGKKLIKQNTCHTDTSDVILQHFTSVWFCSFCIFCFTCVWDLPFTAGTMQRNPDQELLGFVHACMCPWACLRAPGFTRTRFSLDALSESS